MVAGDVHAFPHEASQRLRRQGLARIWPDPRPSGISKSSARAKKFIGETSPPHGFFGLLAHDGDEGLFTPEVEIVFDWRVSPAEGVVRSDHCEMENSLGEVVRKSTSRPSPSSSLAIARHRADMGEIIRRGVASFLQRHGNDFTFTTTRYMQQIQTLNIIMGWVKTVGTVMSPTPP